MALVYLFADRLSQKQLERGRALSIVKGAFFVVMINLAGGAGLTGFALFLGAGRLAIPLVRLFREQPVTEMAAESEDASA